MPVELCFEDRGVRCVYSGEVGVPDVVAALHDIEHHQEADQWVYVLHDCSNIGRFVSGGGEQIRLAAREIDSGFHGARARWAVVAHDGMALRSIEQCFEMAHQPVEVFESLYEAQIWAAASTGFADLCAE